jgi:hypothetical protein
VSNAFEAAAGYSGIVQYTRELDDELTLPNRSGLHSPIAPMRGARDPRSLTRIGGIAFAS